MELGDLILNAIPTDRAFLSAAVDRLAQDLIRVRHQRSVIEFGLDLTRPKPGEQPSEHWQQGQQLRDAMKHDEDQAERLRAALVDYSAALDQREPVLQQRREELNDKAGRTQLLPLFINDSDHNPWWVSTRIHAVLGLDLEPFDDRWPHLPSLATPALIDAVYLLVKQWRSANIEAQPPVTRTETLRSWGAMSFLSPGTTTQPRSSRADSHLGAQQPHIESLMKAAESVVVIAQADARSLRLSQAFITPAETALAVGDGAHITFLSCATDQLSEQLHPLFPLGSSASSHSSMTSVPAHQVEALLSPNATERTQAATALGLTETDSLHDWSAWGVCAVHRHDNRADGASVIVASAPTGLKIAQADGPLAHLTSVDVTEVHNVLTQLLHLQ